MQTLPSVTLPNATTSVDIVWGGDSSQYAYLVLNNESPYAVQAVAGSIRKWISAWTIDAIRIGSGVSTCTVTPQLLTPDTVNPSNVILPTLIGTADSFNVASYPVSNTRIVNTVSGEQLLTPFTFTTAQSTVTSPVYTLPSNTKGIFLSWEKNCISNTDGTLIQINGYRTRSGAGETGVLLSSTNVNGTNNTPCFLIATARPTDTPYISIFINGPNPQANVVFDVVAILDTSLITISNFPANQTVSISGYAYTRNAPVLQALTISVANAITSQTLLASSSNGRNSYSISNSSTTATIYLGFSTTPTLSVYAVAIPPLGYFEGPSYFGSVKGICDIASGNALITEYA